MAARIREMSLEPAAPESESMFSQGSGAWQRTVLWELTGQCNLGCTHCAAPQFIPRGAPNLNFDGLCRVLENLNTGEALHLAFAGGEPLLRPDLLRFVDRCLREPLVARVSCYTNGTLLAELGEALLARGVHLLVSLETVSETEYRRIRRGGNLGKLRGQLVHLAQSRKANANWSGTMSLAFTITSRSGKAHELLKFADAVDADAVIASVLEPYGRALSSDLCPSPSQALAFLGDLLMLSRELNRRTLVENLTPLMVKYFNATHQLALPFTYRGCRALTHRVFVRPDGALVPCRRITPDSELWHQLKLPTINLNAVSLRRGLQDSNWSRLWYRDVPSSEEPSYPCRECEFAGNYCEPCAICGLERRNNLLDLCAFALANSSSRASRATR